MNWYVFDVHIKSLGVIWSRHSNQLLVASDVLKMPAVSRTLIPTPLPARNAVTEISSSDPQVIPEPQPVVQSGTPVALPPGTTSLPACEEVSCEPTLRRSSRLPKPPIRYGFND